MSRPHVGIIATLLTVVSLGAQQAPARDPGATARPGTASANAPSGTATIAGAVTTEERTPRPLRRARVTITKAEGGFTQSVVTDDEGRFAFAGLAAGRYTLQAAKGG